MPDGLIWSPEQGEVEHWHPWKGLYNPELYLSQAILNT